jgi:hypothetical protein
MILLDVLDGLEAIVQLGTGILIGLALLLALAGILVLFPRNKPDGDNKRQWLSRLGRWLKAVLLMLPLVLWLSSRIGSNIQKNQAQEAARRAKVAFGNSFVGSYCLNPIISDSLMGEYHVNLSLRSDSSYQLVLDRPQLRGAHNTRPSLQSTGDTVLVGIWRLQWELNGEVYLWLSGSYPTILDNSLRYTKIKAYPYLVGALANPEWSRNEDRWLSFVLQKDLAKSK